MILRRLDDLMEAKKQDVLLLYFKYLENTEILPEQSIQEHLEWFDNHSITYEQVTDFKNNRDYGDICYCVNFDSPDDARIQEYSKHFENDEFISLKPNEYQMYLYIFVSWYINGGDLHFEGVTDENFDNR
jgi:hypothetical protein